MPKCGEWPGQALRICATLALSHQYSGVLLGQLVNRTMSPTLDITLAIATAVSQYRQAIFKSTS